MQNRDIPGMTQLVAWLTRPAAAAVPLEVDRMLTNITHVEMLRISEKAAMRANVAPTVAYDRIRPVWEKCTPQLEETPPTAAAPIPVQTSQLISYVFDRYWNMLGRLAIEIGSGIPDDDERAVQIMRLLGWKPPELRDPLVLPEQGTPVKDATGPADQ